MRITVLTGIIGFGLTIANISWAQTPPTNTTLPASQDAGAILQHLREEKKETMERKKPVKPKQPQVDESQLTQPKKQPTFKTLTFPVQKIVVQGNTLLDPKDIQTLVLQYEGTEGSVDYFKGLATKLTALYQAKGYLTSYFYLPPQKLKDGTLIIEAFEGHMGTLTIKEGDYFKQRAIRHRISMEQGDPFDITILKRNLRQLNLPLNGRSDLRVGASLAPSKTKGETDVTLTITDKRPYHTVFSMDNLGRRLIGNNRLGAMGIHNNLLGFGDSLMTSSTFSRRSYGLVNNYTVPLNSKGTKIRLEHAFSSTSIGDEFQALQIQSKASVYSGTLSHVVFDKERLRVTTEVGTDFKQLNTDFIGGNLARDQLRIFKAAVVFDEFDKLGSTTFRNEVAGGFKLFGGTDGNRALASRAGAGSDFFRYSATLTRLQKMPFNTLGIFRSLVQLTPDRLVSLEQLQLGGAYTVRGYREGTLIGDEGFLISGEWRAPLFFIPKSWTLPFTNYAIRKNIQGVVFTDFGASFINAPTPGQNSSDYVLGTGAGLRIRLTKHLIGRLDLAVPLLRQAPFSQRPRLHFGVELPLF